MKKYFALAVLLLGLVVAAPALAQTPTVADLQAQIAALMQQIAALTGGNQNNCYTFARNLTLGSTGEDVKALQKFLISKGYSIPAGATGYFGPITMVALVNYQQDAGFSTDQIEKENGFGPLTRANINSVQCGSTTNNQAPYITLAASKGDETYLQIQGERLSQVKTAVIVPVGSDHSIVTIVAAKFANQTNDRILLSGLNLPNGDLSGGNYYVYLTSPNGNSNRAGFTVGQEAATTPSITVLSPNGGETYNVAQDLPVTWNSSNLTGNVDIQLYSADRLVTTYPDTPNDGSEVVPLSVLRQSTSVFGNLYNVRVKSKANSAVSDQSNGYFTITSGSTDTGTVPPKPALTHVDSADKVVLSWGNSGAGIKYDVYRGVSQDNLTRIVTGQDAVSYSDSSISPGVYYYRVCAVDYGSGVMPRPYSCSNIVIAERKPAPAVSVSAPTNLTATTGTDATQVTLGWYQGQPRFSGAHEEVYRSLSGKNNFKWLASVPSENSWYSDVSAEPGVKYDYKVFTAARQNGQNIYSASLQATGWRAAPADATFSGTVPTPYNFSASDGSDGARVVLGWYKGLPTPAGAHEEVYRSPAGKNNFTWLASVPAANSWFSDTTAEPGIHYDYRIFTTLKANGQDYDSANVQDEGWRGTSNQTSSVWQAISGLFY